MMGGRCRESSLSKPLPVTIGVRGFTTRRAFSGAHAHTRRLYIAWRGNHSNEVGNSWVSGGDEIGSQHERAEMLSKPVGVGIVGVCGGNE